MTTCAIGDKHCVPCEGGVPPLDETAIQALLQEVTLPWQVNASKTAIAYDFRFKSYYHTIAFVNAIAWMTHFENHHPDLEVGYNHCLVRYSTHAINGLSEMISFVLQKLQHYFNLMRRNFMTENSLDDHRSLIMSEIMTPDKVNFSGNVHGGYILALLDRVAYACASRYAAKPVVTLSVDQVFFQEPIYVGELVIFYASVNFVGTTSMEVGIRVMAENLLTRASRHTNTCYFTMVAIDDNGKPTQVPSLTVRDAVEQRRLEEAKIRREARFQLSERFKKSK